MFLFRTVCCSLSSQVTPVTFAIYKYNLLLPRDVMGICRLITVAKAAGETTDATA